MKPDWDRLMEDFKGSPTALVAEVDCANAGEDLCEVQGVKGYPSLRFGDPADLQDYEGSRSYDALKAFADKKLVPMCTVANIHLCDARKRKRIEKIQNMDVDELNEEIDTKEQQIKDAEAKFKSKSEKLQATFEKLSKEHEDKIAAIKDAGLVLMRSVRARRASGNNEL